MVDTSKTKAQLIADLETLRARLAFLEDFQSVPGQSTTYLRAIAESAPVGIGLYRQGITLYVNQTYVHMAGYDDSAELVGKHFTSLVPPRFHKELSDRNKRREFGEDTPITYETIALRKDGTEFPVHVQATRIELPDGPATVGFFTDITERKEAEEASRQAEKKYRDIYENAIEGMFQSTPQGAFLTVNPAMARIYGYDSPDEMLSRVFNIADQVYADPQARIEFIRSLQENGRIEGFETRGLRKDGSIIWISCNARAVRDESEAIIYYEGTLEDITKRKQVEKALRESEEKFRTMADQAPMMIGVTDENGNIVFLNKTWLDFRGKTLEEEAGWAWAAGLHPQDRDSVQGAMQSAIDRHEPYSIEYRIQDRHGVYHWIIDTATPLLDSDGQPQGYVGTALDITDRKQVEEALMASEERYRTLAEASHDMIFIIGEEGIIEYVNKFAAKQLRLRPDAIAGKNMAEVLRGETGQRQRENIDRVLATNTPLYVEAPVTFPGGQQWLGTWLVPLKDKTGQVTSVMGVARDITERKRVESELFESRQMLQTVLDNIPQRVFWKDRSSAYVGCNRAFALDCGFNHPSELVGKTDYETASAATADLYRADDRQVMETGRPKLSYEERQVRPDGSPAWLVTNKVPLRDKDGLVIGVLGTYEDITERKRAEEALREKTEELDRFFSLALDLLCIASIDGYFIRLNASWEKTLGYKLKDLEGRRFLDLVHPDDKENTLAAAATLSAGQNVVDFANRYKCNDGSYRWIEWRSTSYQNRLIYAAARDITDRKQTEEALRESEERNRIISGLTTDYVFIVDVDSQGELELRWASETMTRVTGRSANSVKTADLWKDMIIPEDQGKFYQFIRQLIATRQPSEMEVRSFRRGESVWLQLIAYPKGGEGGKLTIVGAVKNITERKRAEEALRESEEKFRHIVDSSPMGMHMYRLEPDGRLVFIGANPAADRILGVENSRFVGKTIEEAFPPLAETEVPERYRLAAARGEAWHTDQITYEAGLIAGAFEVHAFQTSPAHMAAMFLDVTDRRRTEAALKQYTTRLEILHEIDQAILLAETPLAIAGAALGQLRELIPCQRASVTIFDFEHDEVEILASHVSGKTQVNRGLKVPVKKYGIDEEILHGKMLLINDLASQPHLSDIRQILLNEGICSVINMPLVVQNELIGALNLGAAELASFTDEHIEIAREVADQLAITIQHARLRERDQLHAEELEQRVIERTVELRAAYEQLQALSRVKDEFVSNVSHELRSPIASAKAYLHLLVTHPDKQEKHIETLKREITRLEHLIEGLLTLSRLDQNRFSTNLTTIDLNHLIDEYITDRTPMAESKNLTLTFEPSTEIPGVIGDQQLIGDVFSILLTNAFNYTSTGGKVMISTQMQEAEGDLWAGFSVSDSGWGISPEDLPLLFERFYRGKAASETQVSGTGLGLSIAREIVDLHCGRIEVHSDGIPGRGTRFNVWLPVKIAS